MRDGINARHAVAQQLIQSWDRFGDTLERTCKAIVVAAVAIGVWSCGPSSSVADSTPTAGTVGVGSTPTIDTSPPAIRRPAKPQPIGFDEPAAGDTSLTLRWIADADTGGRPLTRFQVMRRQVPGSWPRVTEAVKVAASLRKRTISGLSPGKTYRMRIRACNGNNDATDCSDWAEWREQKVPQPPEVNDASIPPREVPPEDRRDVTPQAVVSKRSDVWRLSPKDHPPVSPDS